MRKLFVFILLFSFLPVIIGAADDLAEIKRILADKSYANYWDRLGAINKLKKMNSRDAAVVLAELFKDDEAPVRESALMALSKFTDKSAIEYLAASALFNIKNSRQRYYAAWALGLIRDEQAMSYLLKAMKNETAGDVLAKVIESIGKMPDASQAEEILINKLSSDSKDVQIAVLKVLGQINSEKAFPYILKNVYSKDINIKIAALEALARIRKEDSLDYLESALKTQCPEVSITVLEALKNCSVDKMRTLQIASGLLSDKNLAVRITAVQCLREIRQKDSVSALISRLPDASWRLRYDIISALKDLTGQPFGFDSKVWLNWYEANKDRIEISPVKHQSGLDFTANPNETIPVFYDIPILGKAIIFIIDFSGSMKFDSEGDDDKGERKIDIAMNELSGTLKSLPADTKFNIIVLSTEATRINRRKAAKSMLAANDNNKKAALEFVKSLWKLLEDIKRGRGDHYDALVEAMNEPEADTIFLLSDGKPTYGTYIYPENIIENIEIQNRYKKVVINTITTGKKGTDVNLMRKLAEISNGIFVSK